MSQGLDANRKVSARADWRRRVRQGSLSVQKGPGLPLFVCFWQGQAFKPLGDTVSVTNMTSISIELHLGLSSASPKGMEQSSLRAIDHVWRIGKLLQDKKVNGISIRLEFGNLVEEKSFLV